MTDLRYDEPARRSPTPVLIAVLLISGMALLSGPDALRAQPPEVFESRLTPPRAEIEEDVFRQSDGQTLFAYVDPEGSFWPDHVTFHELVGEKWTETQGLLVAEDFDAVGVDIEGDLAAVQLSDAGFGVLVFERVGGIWSETARIGPSLGFQFSDGFVEISNGRIAIVDDAVTGVRIYEKVADSWQLVQTVTPPAAGISNFGTAMAIDGEVLMVSDAFFSDPTEAGAIYFYEHDGSDFQYVETLLPPSTTEEYHYRLQLDGDHLVVMGQNVDQLHYYRRSMGAWQLLGTETDASFLYMDLLGDRLVLTPSVESGTEVRHFDGGSWRVETIADIESERYRNLSPDHLLRGLRTVHRLEIDSWIAETEIEPATGPVPQSQAQVGGGLAILGDRLALGIPGYFSADAHDPEDLLGTVAIYDRVGTAWTRTDFRPGLFAQSYGAALSWDGSTGRLQIGGPFSGSSPDHLEGRVDVLEPDGVGGWDHLVLRADSESFDQYGTSVDLAGDLAVAGAIGDDTLADNAGRVDIHQRDAGSGDWGDALDQIMASDGEAGDFFGYSVALVGETVIVGAYGHDGAAANTGAVYVFERSGDTWIESQKLEPPAATGSESFGISMDVHGQTLAVGANEVDAAQTKTGAVHLYERTGPGQPFTPVQVLRASDGAGGDHFGRAVAFLTAGDRLVVGAPEHDAAGEDAGAVYLFENTLGEGVDPWSELLKKTVSDARAGDGLGRVLAGGSDFFAAGGPKSDDGAIDAGVAYVFHLFPSGTLSADLSLGLVDDADPVVSGDTVTYTATVDNSGAEAVPGTAVLFSLPTNLEVVSTSGCAEDPSGYPICTLGSVAATDSAMASLVAASDPNVASTFEVSAAVTFDLPNADPSGDTAIETTIFERGVDLTLGAIGPAGPLRLGQSASYTLNIGNGGPSSADDTRVDLLLPEGLVLSGATGCEPSVEDPVCELGRLAPGASVEVTVDTLVAPTAMGLSSMEVSGSSRASELAPGDEDAVVETAIDATPWASFVESHLEGVDGVTGLSGPTSVSVSGDASFVHVVGASGVIATFRRQWPGCGLDFVNAAAPGSLLTKTSADGHTLVSADGSDALRLYSRDGDGQLTLLSTAEEGVGGVSGLDGITDFDWEGETLMVSSTNPGGVARFSIPPGAPALVFEGADFSYSPNIDYGPIHSIELSESVPPGLSERVAWLASETPRIFLIGESFGRIDTFFATVPTALGAMDGSFEERALYGAAPDSSGLAAFELDDLGSEIARGDVRGLQGLGAVSDVALGPEGLLAYTASPGDDSLGVFYRAPVRPAPAPAQFLTDGVGGVEGLAGATGVAVSPTAECVYVVGEADNALSVFEIDVEAIDVALFADGFEAGNTSAWGN